MEYRFVKDLAYILLVASIIVLAVFAVKHYNTELSVDAKSVYAEQEVDSNLLKKAIEIEQGIKQRKEFIFSINKDPLKQDIILPQKVDEIKLRLQRRYNQIRLYGVLKFGDAVLVGIEHKDLEAQYRIGERIQGSSLSIRSANPVSQTVVLSDGTQLVVKERMDIFNIPSEQKTTPQNEIIPNENY